MSVKNNIKHTEPVDFTELLANYSKKWVVLSFTEDKVLKSGNTYEEIMDYTDKGISMLVPDYSVPFVP